MTKSEVGGKACKDGPGEQMGGEILPSRFVVFRHGRI
jgi:hypothetical protein